MRTQFWVCKEFFKMLMWQWIGNKSICVWFRADLPAKLSKIWIWDYLFIRLKQHFKNCISWQDTVLKSKTRQLQIVNLGFTFYMQPSLWLFPDVRDLASLVSEFCFALFCNASSQLSVIFPKDRKASRRLRSAIWFQFFGVHSKYQAN